MRYSRILPAVLGMEMVAAQMCNNSANSNGYGYGLEQFEPYFFMQEMDSMPPVCNIDPSQSTFDYAVAIGGEFCLDMTDPVSIRMAYTGTDGIPSTATATTVIVETYTSSLDLVFTGLPAAAISPSSPVTVTVYDLNDTYSYCGGGIENTITSVFSSTYVATQIFEPTLFYTAATVTSTVTVPSTTTTTSTITQQAATVAPAVTSTVTISSGTNTVIANTTSTSIFTRTVSQRTLTKTSLIKMKTIYTSSCVAAASQTAMKRAVANRWVGRIPAPNVLAKRQATSTTTPSPTIASGNATATTLSYITGYCSALSSTTLTTATSVVSTTLIDPDSVSTSTVFAYTTTTSTLTATNTLFVTSMGTSIYTPVVTKKTTTVLRRQTTTVTYTTAITRTQYPKHPPVCTTQTAK